MIRKEEKREASLHCHISESNKAWLKRKSYESNRPVGSLVDEAITKFRKIKDIKIKC